LGQLPTNYTPHSALDFGRKGRQRTPLNLANLVVRLVWSALLLWIAVRLHTDLQNDTPVFAAADATFGLIVIGIFLLGGTLLLVMSHEDIHRVCHWLFTGERPSVSGPGGRTYIAPPDLYSPKRLFLPAALAPYILWSFANDIALAFVPAPTIYWLVMVLALIIAVCAGDLT
jgi:hypothetical protein